MSFAPKGKSLISSIPSNVLKKSIGVNEDFEKEQLSQLLTAHKKRAAELDALRLKLETRAIEIEKVQTKVEERSAALSASQFALDAERRRLAVEFDHKVGELADARDRLEAQVAHMELKEAQLHEAFVRLEKETKEKEHTEALNRAQLAAAWARFEAEKANAVSEAETHLATLASALAASLGVENADLGFGSATSTPAAAILASARKFAAAARLPYSPQPFGSIDSVNNTNINTKISSIVFDDISVPDESELLALADRVVAEAVAADAAAGEAADKLTLTSPTTNQSSSFLSPLKETSAVNEAQRTLPFGSPSIPAKIQAVRLKSTLQELSKRTGQISAAANILKERELKLEDRAANLETREREVQALLDRIEALSEREQSLKATVSALQAQVAEHQLAVSVALSPRHITHAAKEQAWKNSLRSDGSSFELPTSPVALGMTQTSQTQSQSPAPQFHTSVLPPVTPGSIIALRVENELREKAFIEREQSLSEKEASIETIRQGLAEETKKVKEVVAAMQKRGAAEASALAQAGRSEIESLRRIAIEESQRQKNELFEEKEQLVADKKSFEAIKQAFSQTKEDILKMRDENQRLRSLLDTQTASLLSEKTAFEEKCKLRHEELSEREAAISAMSEALALRREDVQNSGASALQEVMKARSSLDAERISFEKEKLEYSKSKEDLEEAISKTAEAAKFLEVDKNRLFADIKEREDKLSILEIEIREKDSRIHQSELAAQTKAFEVDMALKAREAAIRESEIAAVSKESESRRTIEVEFSKKLDTEIKLFEEKVASLQGEISNLKFELSKAHDSQSNYISSLSSQESSASLIRSQMEVLSARATALDRRENELVAEKSNVESRSLALKRKLEEVELASVAQSRKSAQLSASHDDLLARRTALENRVKEVRDEALRREKVLAEREKVLLSHNGETEKDASFKIEELMQRCTVLEVKNTETETMNVSLQNNLASSLTEQKALQTSIFQLQTSYASLQSEVVSLTQQLENAKAEVNLVRKSYGNTASMKNDSEPMSKPTSVVPDQSITSTSHQIGSFPFDSPHSKISFSALPPRSFINVHELTSKIPSIDSSSIFADSNHESKNSEISTKNSDISNQLNPTNDGTSASFTSGLPPALPRARSLSRSSLSDVSQTSVSNLETSTPLSVIPVVITAQPEEIVVCSLCHSKIPLSQTRIHSDSCFIVGASTPVSNSAINTLHTQRPSFIRGIAKGLSDIGVPQSPIRRDSGIAVNNTPVSNNNSAPGVLGRIKSLGSGLRSRTNSFISHAVHDVQEVLHVQHTPAPLSIEPASAEEEWAGSVFKLEDFAKGKV